MSEPSQAEIIREAIDSRLLDLHVAMPARVESYDAATQTIEARPMVRRAIEDTEGEIRHEELPLIPNVLVAFPRAGAFSQSWPLSKGDHVLLVFCSSAIGAWRQSGDIADPVDLRRHDLSHAIAIPGIGPSGDTIPTSPTAVVLEVSPPATHVEIGAGSALFVAIESLVVARMVEMVTAITTATIAVGASGAADVGVKLAAAGWTGGGLVPPAMAATKLKSE